MLCPRKCPFLELNHQYVFVLGNFPMFSKNRVFKMILAEWASANRGLATHYCLKQFHKLFA